MSHLLVRNLRTGDYDVNITRITRWGNPFIIGPHGDRTEVIRKYRQWITRPEQEHLVARAKRELRGKRLGCWCAPKACHGDILAELANEA